MLFLEQIFKILENMLFYPFIAIIVLYEHGSLMVMSLARKTEFANVPDSRSPLCI